MTTLFTINKSWHNATWFYEQIAFASKGDSILLIEDAVLNLHCATTLASFLAKCDLFGILVYALRDDMLIRGISNKYDGVAAIDYAEFVKLVSDHQKQVAW